MGLALHPGEPLATQSRKLQYHPELTDLQEGSVSFVIGFISLFLIPNSPTEARFVTESEKRLIVNALHIDGLSVEQDSRENFWTELRSMFAQPHVILMATVGFFFGIYPSHPGTVYDD